MTGKPAPFKSDNDPDWAPSLHLGHENITEDDVARSVARHDRVEEREAKRRKLEEETRARETARLEAAQQQNSTNIDRKYHFLFFFRNNLFLTPDIYLFFLVDIHGEPQVVSTVNAEGVLMVNQACQTDLTCEFLAMQNKHIEDLSEELYQTKKQLLESTQFTEESFKASNRKVKFYTGFKF